MEVSRSTRARGRRARSVRTAQAGQLPLFRARGGARPGAGRKPRGARAGERHKTRPVHLARHPVHVVLRVVAEVGSLRRRHAYKAFREAVLVAARRDNFRVVHVSLQRTHVHLLVEADDKTALARGMQGFQISAAKQLNHFLGVMRGGPRRRGTVFPDRYHAEVITSPRQARHALAYVLLNWRKHRDDVVGRAAAWWVDPFSTGALFPDWAHRQEEPMLWRWPPEYEPLLVRRPRTWLLREGWKRGGPLIECDEVPGAAQRRQLPSR
jgi:REP element-mobilizing transposase RayT